MKKAPQRTCVGCRNLFPQNQLLRLVAGKDCDVAIDRSGRMAGRGAYLCFDEACVGKAKKRQSLQRALKCPLPETIWLEIDQLLAAVQDKGEE